MASPTHLSVLVRLRTAFPDSSGRRLREWLAAGRVRVGGRVVRDPRELVPDDAPVALGAAPPPTLPPPLRLIHEDEAFLVIEKPSGLLSIATERERARTAYRLVQEYLAAQRPPRRPFVVHRLDRDTSGLLVIATSAAAKHRLQHQFAERSVERVYVAVVAGAVRADQGVLESVLVQDPSLRVRPTARPRGKPGAAAGRHAVTAYRVLERRRGTTLLELRLGTGRRHQIRVQLAELGHPIVGDRALGGRTSPIGRLCLHATHLAFRHPVTRAAVRFDSPPPAAFDRVR